MKKLVFANIVALAAALAGGAAAADLPIKAAAPFAERFNWTSCYAGAHLGGGFAQKNITDPVLLVQDSIGGPGTTTGITTVNPSPTGVVLGGQIGCDYQLASSSFVLGAEGSASGSTMRGSREVLLPVSGDFSLVQANTDFLASVTGRIGYAFDNVLVYARGGVALAGDKFEVSGSFTLPIGLGPTPYDFRGLDDRFGWVVGGGVDWAFSRSWSAFLEYDYYGLGHANVLMADGITGTAGIVSFSQHVQVVKAGVNFHVWGAAW
jgi:opacity protein-like surface antigen